VKTKKWPPEIVMKPVKFSGDVRALTERRYRRHSKSMACHTAFELDLYRQTAVVFSHSLDPEQTSKVYCWF